MIRHFDFQHHNCQEFIKILDLSKSHLCSINNPFSNLKVFVITQVIIFIPTISYFSCYLCGWFQVVFLQTNLHYLSYLNNCSSLLEVFYLILLSVSILCLRCIYLSNSTSTNLITILVFYLFSLIEFCTIWLIYRRHSD